jgi:sulfite reductase (ferredoxin)
MAVPTYAEDPSFYTDWGDSREFTIGDLGVGECAGEVVSLFGIEVVRAESQAFDAQCALDEGKFEEAEALAYRAMVSAARALVRMQYIDVTEEPDDVVSEFKKRFYDTELFFDKYAKGKFGSYLLRRHDEGAGPVGRDQAAARVEEALLFIEAAHACDARSSASAPKIVGMDTAAEQQPSA